VNEGVGRAMSLFFASDDVYDSCSRAANQADITAAVTSFLKHACVVPRARPVTRLQRLSVRCG